MKNWKTTLIGAAYAAVTFVATYQANGGNLDDWKLWIIPVLAAALGYVAKDAGVTSSVKIAAAGFLLVGMPSCSVDWKAAGIAATTAAAPIIIGGVNKTAAKNLVKVQP